MIARLRILLPYYFSVRKGDDLTPHQFLEGEYSVKIFPPCQAMISAKEIQALSPTPLRDVFELLKPADPQETTDQIKIDGNPTVQANLLQIDFEKSTFDRRFSTISYSQPDKLVGAGDPPISLGFAIANCFLGKIRTLTRGSQIKLVSPRRDVWRLDYLADDENEIPKEDGMFRHRAARKLSFQVAGLNTVAWSKVQALQGDFTPPLWDTLLLDAEALLPEIGASLTVANAALETFIEWALNQLVPLEGVKPELWAWINDRGDWYQEPSVTEQYDKLLQVLTTKSLKGEERLWEALRNLRSVRTSFVHHGKLVLGQGQKPVTLEMAVSLIDRAKEIVAWVEGLLPERGRRPKLGTKVNIKLSQRLI